MEYKAAIEYIESLASFGSKPGLTRILALLEKLEHPERAYRSIHIAGTNGKGSVAAFMDASLIAAGYKTGRFTSPHLQRYTERFMLCGKEISEDRFSSLVDKVRPHVEAYVEESGDSPTQFEVLTAMAFLYFKEEGVQYAVIETGLGGLLDSTNVITPALSVITNVSFDHMAYCGTTIPEIARHKAGIIKKGVPVVTGCIGTALSVVEEQAATLGAPVYVAEECLQLEDVLSLPYGQEMYFTSSLLAMDKTPFRTQLLGLYQKENVRVAVLGLLLLGVSIPHIQEGIQKANWPGRFEVIRSNERIFILDGAHNAAGAEAFKNTYQARFNARPKTLVMAILSDKEVDAMIYHMVGREDQVITVPAPTPRTMAAEALAQKIHVSAYPKPSVSEGILFAFRRTQPGDIIVVCGSLYILGEAREMIQALDA